jgi:hypothetical protein
MEEGAKITIEITGQEARVLFEYLRRCNDEDRYWFADQAEQRVLWDLECLLEKSVPEVFDPNYKERLRTAWTQLRDKE